MASPRPNESCLFRAGCAPAASYAHRPAGASGVAVFCLRPEDLRHPSDCDTRHFLKNGDTSSVSVATPRSVSTPHRPQDGRLTGLLRSPPSRLSRTSSPTSDNSSTSTTLIDALRNDGLARERAHHQAEVPQQRGHQGPSTRRSLSGEPGRRERRRSPSPLRPHQHKGTEDVPRRGTSVGEQAPQADPLRRVDHRPDSRSSFAVSNAIIASRGTYRFRARHHCNSANTAPLKAKAHSKGNWAAIDELVAEASAGSPTDGHSHSLLELYLWLKTCVLEPHTAADLGLLGVPAGVEEAALEDADIERLLTFA